MVCTYFRMSSSAEKGKGKQNETAKENGDVMGFDSEYDLDSHFDLEPTENEPPAENVVVIE